MTLFKEFPSVALLTTRYILPNCLIISTRYHWWQLGKGNGIDCCHYARDNVCLPWSVCSCYVGFNFEWLLLLYVTYYSMIDDNDRLMRQHRVFGYNSGDEWLCLTCVITTVWAKFVPYDNTSELQWQNYCMWYKSCQSLLHHIYHNLSNACGASL